MIPTSRLLRLLVAALLLLCAVGLRALPAAAQDDNWLGLSSSRYIVVDADTGEVFAEYNADERVAIASLTKTFTTIEALERGDLDMLITTNESDVFDPESSTVMGFGPGETFTLRDLLFGMMLPSGNDAAHAIARALGAQPGDTSDEQSVDRFVGWMNERAANMGLADTHFMNPHGWGVDGHYSTARDIARFVMYAQKYPMFREIISTAQYSINGGEYVVSNTNKLLGNFNGLVGGKTGYDNDSGYCLIELADRGDLTMISVTLDGYAPDVWYQDNATLLDYGFERETERVAAGDPISGDVVSYRDPDLAVIEQGATAGGALGAPIQPGDATAGTDAAGGAFSPAGSPVNGTP